MRKFVGTWSALIKNKTHAKNLYFFSFERTNPNSKLSSRPILLLDITDFFTYHQFLPGVSNYDLRVDSSQLESTSHALEQATYLIQRQPTPSSSQLECIVFGRNVSRVDNDTRWISPGNIFSPFLFSLRETNDEREKRWKDRKRERERERERTAQNWLAVWTSMSRRRRRTHIHQGGPQADHYCGLSAVIEFKHQRRYYLTN